ncbi:MAG: PAS domain-containing protein [Pseudomonadota bacterium]
MGHPDFRVIAAKPGFDPLDVLWAHWNGLRTAGPVPRRSDVRPAQLGAALECAFVLEWTAAQHARFRVVGGTVNDLLDMDVRGMPFTALFDPGTRALANTYLRHVFETPSVLSMTMTSNGHYGSPGLDARLIILPLLDDQMRPTRAIGCIDVQGDIGETPRRFDTIKSVEQDMLGAALGPVDRGAASTQPAAVTDRPRVIPRPHLRVVQ